MTTNGIKKTRAYQAGVSLIELMISITIGVVILGAILAVYAATSSTGRQSETATRMSEDAAVAMNYMANYIRMAGYSVPRQNASENTAVVGTATLSVNDSNFDVNATAIRGCDGGFSNPTVSQTTSLTCASSTATAAIAVKFEGDVFNTAPVSGNPSDCLNQAVSANAVSAYDTTTAYTLVEARFYVKTGTNSGVPELYCGGNGAAGFTAQPIMQYVESLGLTYGVADDGASRLVTSYLTAADVDALAGTVDQKWRRVVNVKLCVLMRSEGPDQNDPRPYVNCAGALVTPTDRFVRRAFRSVVTIRNRGGIS